MIKYIHKFNMFSSFIAGILYIIGGIIIKDINAFVTGAGYMLAFTYIKDYYKLLYGNQLLRSNTPN